MTVTKVGAILGGILVMPIALFFGITVGGTFCMSWGGYWLGGPGRIAAGALGFALVFLGVTAPGALLGGLIACIVETLVRWALRRRRNKGFGAAVGGILVVPIAVLLSITVGDTWAAWGGYWLGGPGRIAAGALGFTLVFLGVTAPGALLGGLIACIVETLVRWALRRRRKRG